MMTEPPKAGLTNESTKQLKVEYDSRKDSVSWRLCVIPISPSKHYGQEIFINIEFPNRFTSLIMIFSNNHRSITAAERKIIG